MPKNNLKLPKVLKKSLTNNELKKHKYCFVFREPFLFIKRISIFRIKIFLTHFLKIFCPKCKIIQILEEKFKAGR